MIQSATPFIKGIDEYLKLEPEHPELAERIGRCLHKMGKLPYPEPDKPPARPLHRRGASEEQKHAIETALTAPLSYITAGPGSGKTSMVLVSAAVSLLRAGRRVMITAFTNSAVEHALSSVLAALGEEAKAYAPMRLGRSSEGFSTRWGELCTNTGEEPQLVGITLDLLAKALSEGTLGFEPDHILIDEAAYAPLVKVLPLLTYRKSRITMLGDHHQLPPVCEGTLNEMLSEHLLEDPRFLAVVMMKGTGLDVGDLTALQIRDLLLDERDPMKVFVSLRREYANSAVQLYTFPMMPYEAMLLNRYLTWLGTCEPGRTEPDRYLLSDDPEGREPMPTRGFHAFVRNLLMKVVVGYADRLGSTDLSKQKGAEFLKRTYRHRLEEYCGLTEQPDPDALTFLLHQSLAGHVQADNYRCFTDPFGRERLLAYVFREQRFIQPRQKWQKQILKSKDGGSDVLTFRNWEHQENRRIVLTFEAAEDGEARFSAPYGALFRVEKLPPEQHPTEEANGKSETAVHQ